MRFDGILTTWDERQNLGFIAADQGGQDIVVPGSALALQPGDVIALSGEVQEFYCLTELYVAKPTDIDVVTKQAPPLPYEVAWNSLSTGNIEALEGVLDDGRGDNAEVDDIVAAGGEAADDAFPGHAAGGARVAADDDGAAGFEEGSEGGREIEDVTGGQTSSHDAAQADVGDAKAAVASHFPTSFSRPKDSGT